VLDRKLKYSPGDSRFAYQFGQHVMPTMAGYGIVRSYGLATSELRKAIVQSGLLAEARAWNAGSKTYGATAPAVTPLVLPGQVWELNNGGGEVDRFYFVPVRLTTRHGEYVDVHSELYFDVLKGLVTHVKTPMADMRRFKVYAASGPKTGETFGCAYAIMDIAGEPNLKHRFCGSNDAAGTWGMALMANSPTRGAVKGGAVEGQSYRKDGSKGGLRSVVMEVGGRTPVTEYRVLPPDEAAQVRARLR
jgi:hypothetical protein